MLVVTELMTVLQSYIIIPLNEFVLIRMDSDAAEIKTFAFVFWVHRKHKGKSTFSC